MNDAVFAHQEGFLHTSRQDTWWLEPLATAVGLLAFIVHSTWAALQGEYYEYGPYLSPSIRR